MEIEYAGVTLDPVTAGIVRGAFETICYEVATHLGRCASSAIIHQSNERINQAYAERMGVPEEKIFSTIGQFGNTTAATIPLGLAEAVDAGVLKPGMLVLSCSFGSGLTWASALYRW